MENIGRIGCEGPKETDGVHWMTTCVYIYMYILLRITYRITNLNSLGPITSEKIPGGWLLSFSGFHEMTVFYQINQ